VFLSFSQVFDLEAQGRNDNKRLLSSPCADTFGWNARRRLVEMTE
jgi:hypothetical protein